MLSDIHKKHVKQLFLELGHTLEHYRSEEFCLSLSNYKQNDDEKVSLTQQDSIYETQSLKELSSKDFLEDKVGFMSNYEKNLISKKNRKSQSKEHENMDKLQ